MNHLIEYNSYVTQGDAKLYHITDNPNFTMDSEHTPEDNSTSIHDRSGRKGIYLTSNVDHWNVVHGYYRPFIAEFIVDKSIMTDPKYKDRWNYEYFIPQPDFHLIKLNRVIPSDALDRETHEDYGRFEREIGVKFDTGEPIPEHKGNIRPVELENYKYTGKDVRNMSMSEIQKLKKDFDKALSTISPQSH